MKFNKVLLIAPIIFLLACGKPKPFCGKKCMFEKLKTFNKVSRVYINGIDHSEEYYRNDSVFKEIIFYDNSSTMVSGQKVMSFKFGFRWMNNFRYGTVVRYLTLDVSGGKKIYQENKKLNDGTTGDRELLLYDSDTISCQYIPFRDLFLHKDVSEILITEIEDDHLTWEYDFKDHHVKVIFKAR